MTCDESLLSFLVYTSSQENKEENTVPLAFESLTHGTVAFGFFNIDSDLLLLDRYFLFATEFCESITIFDDAPVKASWKGYFISDPGDIGDLMGAIHGISYTGFIGELYRRFPFPKRPEDFKQKPEGFKNRAVVENLIARFAKEVLIPISVPESMEEVCIGEYRFSRQVFHEFVRYVWRGGYPRWKDEIRPDYVLEMKRKTEQQREGLFAGLILDE